MAALDSTGGLDTLMAELSFIQSKILSRTSTENDVKRGLELKKIIAEVDASLVKKRPDQVDWVSLGTAEAVVYLPNEPTCKKDLHELRLPVEAEGIFQVQIAEIPFSRGEVRVAFWARLRVPTGDKGVYVWKTYVAKQFLDPKNQTKEEVLNTLEGNSVTKFLAEEWMRCEGRRQKKVECLEARALVVNRDGHDIWYMFEGLIEGEFEKWTNNSSFAEPKAPVLLNFAKWTHKWTDGFMMVTDLQGGETSHAYTLTDPAILCKDLNRFSPTNFSASQFDMCLEAVDHALRHKKTLPGIDKRTSHVARFSRRDDGSRFRAERLLHERRLGSPPGLSMIKERMPPSTSPPGEYIHHMIKDRMPLAKDSRSASSSLPPFMR
jgi:hypothetical protein